ncbi:Helix-turn-helix domain protein [Sulfitobacter sp. THAF37]|uniref:short-chain fatty acyl-CoA regulator family protein n=1 Tax=Sulfitobacter sp. THAF37 TaxID=2587855 RepID=UPI0012693EAA|nr:short-chain fatty acyl-CoA regulator family protein [Sulfitobacter sp. THAF37]QFT59617.1 Helix-turn-helix domain protein [Sulfitobacter sp. THAF37]
MAREGLTGSRIRERRIMASLKQAELARAIGISASYLNLIEHNKRRIGGKLLLDIAAALEVEPQTLSEGAEATLIAALREAAHEAGLSAAESGRAEEFASRFPGWADVLSGARRRIDALEATVEALTDRLGHDPYLAASMHELLTTAAAVRSTASILAETKTLQPEWRDRFHANLNEDSDRLSTSAQNLVAYLDAETGSDDAVSSPQEEVEAFLSAQGFSFDALEQPEAPDGVIEDLVAEEPALRSPAARFIARAVLRQVARDAAGLPLGRLRDAVETCGVEPLQLARTLDQPVGRILRRLAALPELEAGLIVCDRSGTVTFRKSVDGFSVPRHGACCPLWPLFAALGQPGAIIACRVGQMGRAQGLFQSYALSEPVGPQDYNMPPMLRSNMLLLPVPEGAAPEMPVGVTCRICPREECAARREPSILSA